MAKAKKKGVIEDSYFNQGWCDCGAGVDYNSFTMAKLGVLSALAFRNWCAGFKAREKAMADAQRA